MSTGDLVLGEGGSANESHGHEVDALLKLCTAIATPRDLEGVLESILAECRQLTNADAGSLYIVEKDKLRFKCVQNATLQQYRYFGNVGFIDLGDALPLDGTSVAGYVATAGEWLNIEDVYDLPPDVPYHFNRDYDLANNYRTKSVIAMPLKDHRSEVIGVLQLINRMDRSGRVIPFSQRCRVMLESIGNLAAMTIRNARLNEQLDKSYLDTIIRLSMAAEYRDKATADHIHRMASYCQAIARALGFSDDQAKTILYASTMHDIGKLGIPDAILTKPGKLTTEEFELMKRHTIIGGQILTDPPNEILSMAQKIVLTHHEKWDGTGYPKGLKGGQIPIEGRISALADVFDAMSSARCYKPAFELAAVEQEVRDQTGRHFDPQVVEAFFSAYDDILFVYHAVEVPGLEALLPSHRDEAE